MDVKVHVLGIKGDRSLQLDDDGPDVLLHGIVEVDGTFIEEIGAIEVYFGGGDMVTLKAVMHPGSFAVETHNDVSWPALLQKLTDERLARGGSGRIVASTEASPG